MLEIAEKLLELSEMIGNGASVSIECRRHEGLSPTMIFKVDWENDFHFKHELSFVRLAAQPDDILKIFAYHAQREYAQQSAQPKCAKCGALMFTSAQSGDLVCSRGCDANRYASSLDRS